MKTIDDKELYQLMIKMAQIDKATNYKFNNLSIAIKELEKYFKL